jgi:hypothetical protein
MSGGSSSPTPTSTTTGLAALPDWAQGYAKDALSNAASLTNINTNPYQAYDAQRIADFSPMQQQAQQGAANMQPSNALGVGQDMAQAAGLSALGTGYNASNYGSQFNPQGTNYNAQNTQAASLGYAPQISAGQYGTPLMNTAQTGYNPNLQTYQMGPAQQVNTQSFAQPGAADAYMSPYMQSVVDIQKREAQRQSGIQGTQQQAQATQAGAFGGSRDAIMRAERERNLGTQMNDIQAQGSQAAYSQAQQQFNAEQQARLAAQQANQQAGITVGGQNLGAALGVQQLGTQTGLQTSLANLSSSQQANVQNQAAQLQTQGLNAQQAMQAALANQQTQSQYGLQQGQLTQQANLANQAAQNQAGQFNAGQNLQAAGLGAQYGQAANQLNEQSRQYGAGLGLQGLQTGLQAAGQLGTLGQNEYAQNMGINQLQGQYGAQQQAQQQQGLSQSYQDFLNQQNYPYKQMGFMSDMLRGLPLGQQSTQSIYQAPPSMLQSAGALGLGAIGLKQAGLFAEGGQVKSYASGGDINSMDDPNAMTAAVSKLSDAQLQQIVQRPSSAAELQAAKLELATRASEKSGLAGAYNMAQGGMVAFARGGIPRYDGEDDSLVDGGGGDQYTQEDAQDAQDEQTQGGSLSDAALHAQAVRTGLSSLRSAQNRLAPETIDANDPNNGLSANMATMRKLAGPDPYPEIKGQIANMASQSQQALEQGKGLAALHAMGALLQGPDFMRALGGAGSAFADSYGQAMQANRAAQQAQMQMSINVAAGQRAENLGLAKDAMGSFQAANANKIAVYKAQNDRDRNLATAAARLANATKAPKPVAAVKPSAQAEGVSIYAADAKAKNPNLTDVQAQAIGLRQYNTEKAAGLAGPALTAAASNQRAAQTDALTLVQQDSAAREKAGTAAAADLLMNKEYRAAKRDPNRAADAQRIEQETFTKHYNQFRPSGSAPPAPLNLNAPKAGSGAPAAAPAAAPKPAAQIPTGATYGKAVPGKGTEVFVGGKLVGYAN